MPLVALVVALVGASLASAQNPTLPARETLSYNVEWRLITAGKARVEWSSAANTGWQLNLHLISTGLVSKLFKVDDDYTARMNQSLCMQSSFLKAEEGSRRRETRVNFAAGKANYVERDTVKNATVLAQEIQTPVCVHDVSGGLFLMRTLPLEPGQSTTVPVTDGKKSVMARIEAQQREDVKTPSGTYKTIRYEVFLFNDVLYRRYGRLHVWLSDDASRIPVQIRVRLQFAIGTITLLLEKRT